MLRIHSTETFATQDGPGIRLVFFTQGCNFRCLYCENPDTIDCTGGLFKSTEELVEITKKEWEYFGTTGGVTISGGEPLLQAKEIIPFFKELKKMGIHTSIDTNASILNSEVKELLKYTDLVIPDIKQINNEAHKKLTKNENGPTLKFIEYLEKIKKRYWLRQVIVPGRTDQKKDLETLGAYIQTLKYAERIEILPYHNLGEQKWKELGWEYTLAGLESPSKNKIQKIKKLLEKYHKNIIVRGL